MKWYYIMWAIIAVAAFGAFGVNEYSIGQCKAAGLTAGKLSVVEIQELCENAPTYPAPKPQVEKQ